MNDKFDVFEKMLSEWWFSQIRDLDVGSNILKVLRHPSCALAEDDFKQALARAILDRKFSPDEYERLTEMDFETRDEVVSDLMEFWRRIFGDEPVGQRNSGLDSVGH